MRAFGESLLEKAPQNSLKLLGTLVVAQDFSLLRS